MAQTTIRQIAHALGFKESTLANSDFNVLGPAVSPGDLRLRSPRLTPVTGAALTEDTAYFVYLGKTNRRLTAQKVLMRVTTGGTGAQVAEIGLFSTPVAPNGAAQTLTKIVATGTLDDLTGTGILGNTTAFARDIPAGTHLWAGVRTAMATNEPTPVGVGGDESQGYILTTATAGALTSGTTFAGALVTAALTTQGPNLSLSVT